MMREPVEISPRRMTVKRRLRLLERDNWMCCVPGCPKYSGWPLELDHILPIELGGSDDDENLIAICRLHHLEKTRADIKRIRKAARLRRAQDPETRKHTKRPLKGRGFQKTLRRKVDGTVQSVVPPLGR